MFGGFGNMFKGLFSQIGEFFKGIFSFFKEIIGGLFKSISGLFSSLFGGMGGGIGGLFGGLFHGGGISHSPTIYRRLPSGSFAFAPHFASGFAPNEYPAVLHRNEAVIPLAGGRYIPVKLQSSEQNKQPVNISIYTRDPETKIKYKPSRSQQRAALINVSRRGMVDI